MNFHSHKWIKTVGCISVFTTLLFARAEINNNNPDFKLGISSLGWVESGQMVKYFMQNGQEKDHGWISRTFLDLTIDAVYKERLKMAFGIEGALWYNTPLRGASSQDPNYVHKKNSLFIISDANATYSLGDVRSPVLSIEAGLFRYKYNAQARNLGEYLFRSGTYPAFVINNFDMAYARLTGFKVSSELLEGNLHQDLIFNIETELPPFFDGSLSYLLGYNFKKIVDVGAGVSFAHLVSVDERITTPKKQLKNRYINAPGDTGYYTYRGTKLMGRLCFDPKALLSVLGVDMPFFGSEDLKIFGEALVLGLESYPANDSIGSPTALGKNVWGYDSVKNKIPLIFGFNFPTFKLLDVLALEFEWYGMPYANSYHNYLGSGYVDGYPVPDNSSHIKDYTKDNWKWSVYAKKTFFNDHLGIIFQIARDHIRNLIAIDEGYNYEEVLSKTRSGDKMGQFWWMVKLQAGF